MTQYPKNRSDEILGLIRQYIAGNKSARIQAGESKDELDIIAQALNALGEKLLERKRTYENTVARLDTPNGKVAISSIRDISEKKMLEQALRNNEEQLREIGSSLFGVALQYKMGSGKASFPFISVGSTTILGVSPEVIYSDPLSAFKRLHPEDSRNLFLLFESSSATLEPFLFTFRVKHPDEINYRWIQGHASPRRLEDGGTLWNAYLIDITATKESELILEARNKELKKTNEELDRFVYSTSHDLRAPLLSVLGLIDLSVNMINNKPRVLTNLEMMKGSVKRLDGVINEILSYSRNSRMELIPEVLPVKSIIEGVIDGIRFMKTAENIHFSVLINESVPFVSDKIRVTTLITNLVTNAVLYQNKGELQPFVKVTFDSNIKEGKLTVEDNGEGIPENRINKIFEMFFRNSENSVGSGLGLYICQEIVNKLGGAIKVQSVTGKGSVFTIHLPNRYAELS